MSEPRPRTAGGLIRWHRKRQGLSATKLAAKMGLSVVYVCEVERGNRNMRTVKRFAEALGVPLSEFPGYCAHCGGLQPPPAAQGGAKP